jgi:hypothetical protein
MFGTKILKLKYRAKKKRRKKGTCTDMVEVASATMNSKFFAVSFAFLWRVHKTAGNMNTSFEIMRYAMNNTYLRGEPDIEGHAVCLDTRRK